MLNAISESVRGPVPDSSCMEYLLMTRQSSILVRTTFKMPRIVFNGFILQ